MKIYLEGKRIRQENYDLLVRTFPDIEFVGQADDCYDCDVLIVDPPFVKEENISKYPNLKWIQLLTAGFDAIDLNVVKKRNITITNAKGVFSKTIAEDVICKILTINRNVKYYLDNMEKGIWHPIRNEPEICGSTIGIIGVGSIAKEIAKRMKSFETKVIGYRRSNKPEEYFDEIYYGADGFNNLLKQSDYVILALPLNKESQGLFNREKFQLMKETAVLINIARGEIVNQPDLIEALKNKKIRAAGLDVTVPEPLPPENELWKLDNVFITPHNSVSSPILFYRLTQYIIDNIRLFKNNQPLLNIIDE